MPGGQFRGIIKLICSDRSNLVMQKVAKKFNFHLEIAYPQESSLSLRCVWLFQKLNSCILPDVPGSVLNTTRVGVAVHDPGGAEWISCCLRNLPQRIRAYFDWFLKCILIYSGTPFDEVVQLSQTTDFDLITTDTILHQFWRMKSRPNLSWGTLARDRYFSWELMLEIR